MSVISATLRTVASLAILGMLGCESDGPMTGSARGRITYQSQPVTAGMVVFESPSSALIASADLDADGRYEIADLRVAEYHVSVQPPQPQVPNESTHSIEEIQAYSRNPQEPDPKNIPRPVRSTQTTPLRANVVEGENTFDFDLAEASRS